MTKEKLIRKLQENTLTLDDMRTIAYTMSKMEVADILVELSYALYVECKCDEGKANRALLGCLLERWEEEL